MANSKSQKAAQHARKLLLEIKRDKEGNPLTLEGCIRSMILKSPDSIKYRDDALNIMYCVLGAGIDWKDGRLTDYSSNNYMNLPPDTYYGIWSRDFGKTESLTKMVGCLPKVVRSRIEKDFKNREEKQLNDAILTVEEINERCKTYRPNRGKWYPISWYGCNLCAPVNAQDDFLDGAVEIASLISLSEVDFYCSHIEQQYNTIQFAKSVLEILKIRIENREKK